MKKEECIARYGEAAWAKKLEQRRAYHKEHREEENARMRNWKEEHREEENARSKKYREEHPEEVKVNSQEQCRRGGKYYDKNLKDQHTGLQGEKGRIRVKHAKQYRPYKMIIAPDSQIHHEWVPDTAEYRGVALVEKDAHQYGIIDVIQILDGKITLLTEEQVKRKQIKKSG